MQKSNKNSVFVKLLLGRQVLSIMCPFHTWWRTHSVHVWWVHLWTNY